MKIYYKIIMMLLATSALAMAGPPVKFPSCSSKIKIKHPKNSAGVFFDENCEIAYVLPPEEGRIVLNGLTPNMNLQLCPAYESTLGLLNNQYKELKKVGDRMNSSPSTDHDIDDGTSIDGSDHSVPQPVLATDPALIAEFHSILERIELTKKSLKSFETPKGVAVGKIHYKLNWNELLSSYQILNPHLHFERLPLEAGRIVFARKVGSSDEIVTGAVAHSIQGIENNSGILENGTLQPTSGSVIMSDAVSGQVVLNFAGACPFVKNGKLQKDLSESEMDAYLAANFQYKYSVQGLRRYRASYNLASIAKHIQESRSRGGLFSSKTINSLTETNSSSDEFNMVIESNQQSFEFDSSLRSEVKTELISRVMREMVAMSEVSPVQLQLTSPPPRGAVVAANELQKYPHFYTQLGAAGLRVLDSVFGNSSAVAKYIKEKNGVAVDDVTEKRMFNYLGSSTFSGEKNEL